PTFTPMIGSSPCCPARCCSATVSGSTRPRCERCPPVACGPSPRSSRTSRGPGTGKSSCRSSAWARPVRHPCREEGGLEASPTRPSTPRRIVKESREGGSMRLRLWIVLGLTLAVTMIAVAQAPTLADRAAAIDRVVTQPEGYRVVVGHISRELSIVVDTLRAQHAQTGLSWGEILIAHRVSREAKVSFD